ncbi:carbamoyltransferase C-terminal domain-containing protein [Paenibacillus sp. FJAT-26967]|uniref:carbamoyltransferase family protein n=1 Tax=Paenibacillus sp. FJAT-26967 TaxID=1729690 RepID=UPI000837EC6C|nr:carbamoyltransferase C-terminal domain-containing protein [Paenibacillus sp. FJAT-26967]
MNILGIGGSIHDFSACLVRRGEVRYAVEEERLNRVKHCLGMGGKLFRCKAAEYCLEAEGLHARSLDLIVGNDLIEPVYFMKYGKEIKLINHHLAHASSAFYPSPYKQAAVLVADGRGSFTGSAPRRRETVTYYWADSEEIREIKKLTGEDLLDFTVDHESEKELTDADMSHSIGGFYERVTFELGFGLLQEGKTMGLSAYGTPRYIEAFYGFYSMDGEGNFSQTLGQLSALRNYIRQGLSPIKDAGQLLQTKADLAYAAQYHIERILIMACRYLHEVTGSRNLCLAGGVFLNSVANYRILRETPFENVFIQPAAGDAGTAVGSALYGAHMLGGEARKVTNIPFSPYLGKSYGEKECLEAALACQDELERVETDDVYRTAAGLLSEGCIIGWFQGRSEIGPRALGNRSIIADPRHSGMKDTINDRIKHREAFRPFAPAVLRDRQGDYFELKHASPYMLMVSPFLEGKGAEAGAVCHEDGTGRVQTVTEEMNAPLYRLISAFDEITGVPVLLNTSFNDNGEPIVETPSDAISCFLRIDLDYLVMNQMIFKKRSRGVGNSW